MNFSKILVGLAVSATLVQKSPAMPNKNHDSDRNCEITSLVVFIGNAEPARLDYVGNEEKNAPLYEEVLKSSDRLRSELLSRQSKCPSNQHGKTQLLTIIDGPGRPDSKISLEAFSNATDASVVDSFQLNGENKIVASTAETKFEIHLPTSTQAIVEHFVNQLNSVQPSGKLDRIVYVIKSHGVRYQDPASTLTDEKVVAVLKQQTPEKNFTHATLLDPHGPDTELHSSGLYGMELDLNKFCARRSKKFDLKLARYCSLSVNLSNETLDPYTNGTLDPYTNGTLDPYTNGTLDPYTNGTLDPYTNGTLGAGKSFYLANPSNTESDFWKDWFELSPGYVYAGEETSEPLKLPLIGTLELPGLVILDSCWGTGELSKSMFANGNNETTYVAFKNSQVGVSELDYSSVGKLIWGSLPEKGQSSYLPEGFTLQGQSWN